VNNKPPTQRLGLIVVLAGIAIGVIVLVLQSMGPQGASAPGTPRDATRVMGASAPEIPVRRIEMKKTSDKGR
jgi:hypothetical protein